MSTGGTFYPPYIDPTTGGTVNVGGVPFVVLHPRQIVGTTRGTSQPITEEDDQ